MTEDEKKKFDIEGIATLFKNVMFGMAFILLLGYAAVRYFSYPKAQWIALFGAILIGIPYLIVRANSKRYRREKEE